MFRISFNRLKPFAPQAVSQGDPLENLDRGVRQLGIVGFWGVVLLVAALVAFSARGHDTWVQTNTNLIRTGDVIHIDLMLVNHGNDHRDYKLASKIGLDGVKTVEVQGPDGFRYDIKPELVDLGLAPKEGFHSARFVPAKPGLYAAVQTSDKWSTMESQYEVSKAPKPTLA